MAAHFAISNFQFSIFNVLAALEIEDWKLEIGK